MTRESDVHRDTGTMTSRTIIEFAGQAIFEGTVRCWDDRPHALFSVQLANQPLLYGTWKPRFAENENDFDIEITGFGWGDKYNAGNPNPITRCRLSISQASDVKKLVVDLMNNVKARQRIIPFSSNTAQFLGGIHFRPNAVLSGS